ncbi:MAG: hypothetical protein ACC656_07535, partial [Candidatus Heimdallarchaeota archaeon]
DEGLSIKSGVYNYTVTWVLAALPEIILSELLKRSNSTIMLTTNLLIQINDLVIEASPDLRLTFGDNLVDFAIVEVTNFDANQTAGTFTVVFDMELLSNIPIVLNITSILMTFTTVSNVELGQLNWENQDLVSILPYSSVIVTNVSVAFSDISASTIIELVITQSVKVPKATITLQFFDEEIEIQLTLEKIDF